MCFTVLSAFPNAALWRCKLAAAGSACLCRLLCPPLLLGLAVLFVPGPGLQLALAPAETEQLAPCRCRGNHIKASALQPRSSIELLSTPRLPRHLCSASPPQLIRLLGLPQLAHTATPRGSLQVATVSCSPEVERTGPPEMSCCLPATSTGACPACLSSRAAPLPAGSQHASAAPASHQTQPWMTRPAMRVAAAAPHRQDGASGLGLLPQLLPPPQPAARRQRRPEVTDTRGLSRPTCITTAHGNYGNAQCRSLATAHAASTLLVRHSHTAGHTGKGTASARQQYMWTGSSGSTAAATHAPPISPSTPAPCLPSPHIPRGVTNCLEPEETLARLASAASSAACASASTKRWGWKPRRLQQ